MPLGLLGTKVGMTQVYDENGMVSPVTVLQLGPCPVLQVKSTEPLTNQTRADGYYAVQLGYQDKLRRKATRPESGHVSSKMESKRRAAGGKPLRPKPECEPQKVIKEFRLDTASTLTVGSMLTIKDVFAIPMSVDVIAKRKGRGFQGVMKRHGFGGLPAAHGAKKVHRQQGGTGSLASNRGSGRMKQGKKMAGRYGATQITIRNLVIVKIIPEENLLLVRGAVPGPNGGVVTVRPTNMKR